MKKISAILVAVLFVLAMVPFAAMADGEVTVNTPAEVKAKVGDETATFEITLTIADGEYLLDGSFTIEFPADKLELIIPEGRNGENKISGFNGAQVNVNDAATGKILVGYANADGYEGEQIVATLNFKLLDAAEGDEYDITVAADRMVIDDGSVAGANIADGKDTAGKIIIEAAQQPTDAEPTDAEPTDAEPTDAEPTNGDDQPATQAPEKTGESTPWALIATVAAAGAALVVLSTKKSK